MIPVFGPVVASAITVLVTLIEDPAAVAAAVVLLVYMQVEAYILTPKNMTRAAKVLDSLVIVAALAGVALGGVLGVFVAVPVAAAAVTIVEQVIVPRQNKSRSRPSWRNQGRSGSAACAQPSGRGW